MAKLYYKLPSPVRDMTAQELRAHLGGVPNAVILRSIILNEKEYLDVEDYRSLRGFWYRTVKPALEKLGLLSDELEEEAVTKWDSKLSDYMAELVKLGVLTYRDLKIIDESRDRSTPDNNYLSPNIQTYGYKVNIPPYPNILLCVEKDTVYYILRDLASLFGCSCISGRGMPALGAMEDLIREMGEKAKREDYIMIMSLTDFDPWGYNIADTFENQAKSLINNMGLVNPVYNIRLGLKPDQLSPEQVQKNMYTPKFAARGKTKEEQAAYREQSKRDWVELTGGINGEPKGLELDALEPPQIRALFIDEIRRYIDPQLYREFIRPAYLQKIVLEGIQDKIEAMVEDITAEYLPGVGVRDFDIFELAQDGYSYLPVEELCYTASEEEVKQRAMGYFKP